MATETPIKTTFRKQFAKNFMNSFESISDSFYFLYYGRVHPWDDDGTAPTTIDTFASVSDGWNNMIGLQLIQNKDLSLVIPRYDWTKNTLYAQYDDSVDLFNENCPQKFYVVNSDNRVYKCISNNSGAKSVNEPISTTTNIFQTPDGYKWKFLYQIAEDDKKFVTSEYVPVETLTGVTYTGEKALQYDVQQKAVDGSIDQIDISQQGTYWPQTVVANNEFEIQQNVVVAAAAAGDTTVNLNMKNILTYAGAVPDIVGYSLYIYSGAGAGQYIEITNATTTDDAGVGLGFAKLTLKTKLTRGLSVASADISRFEILPTINILGNGSGAVAIPNMKETAEDTAQYVVDSVLMVNPGRDYSVVRVECPRPSGSAQSTLSDNLQTKLKAQISPPGGHGADAETELGAREVMLNVRTDGEVGGAMSAVNDFRQFGVVKNPLVYKGPRAGQLAGDEQDERIRLRVVRPEQIRIDFDLTTGADSDNYYPEDGGTNYDYVVGSEVIQEDTGARGIVIDWVPPVSTVANPTEGAGDRLVGKLYLEVTSGEFIKNSRIDNADGTQTAGLAIYGAVNGYPSYDRYNNTDQPFDLLDYTNNTFDVGSLIIGTTSNATAEIVDWVVDEGGQSGFLYLKDVKGTFLIPRIDPDTGLAVDGERISQFSSVDPYSGSFNVSNIHPTEGNKETNAGILGSDTVDTTVPIKGYKQSYVLNVLAQNDASVFVEGDFPKDAKVTFKRGTTTLGTGYVVDTIVGTTGGDAKIEVTSVRDWDGEFLANDTVTYIDTTGIIKTDTSDPTGTRALIDYPSLKPDSGEMLYIQNILPVMRNTERAEEMKLLLKF